MTAVIAAPGLPVSRFNADPDALSTIRDPRTPGEGPSPTGSGTSTPHPDLNTEVATLSNKLISAINHQTHLDDALSAARQEFEAAQSRIRMLEAEKAEHGRKIQDGELVRREEMDAVRVEFGERDRRTQTAEQDKRRMEQELENLTSTLFEEANEMVAAARKETKASEMRNDQLRKQIADTESLLASQQEQLIELKSVMEQMNQREDRDGTNSTTPSSPALPLHSDSKHAVEALHSEPSASHEGVSPAPPTSFSHLLSPVLRMDLAFYEDFRTLAEISKRSISRVNSGAYAAGSIPGMYITAPQPSQSSTSGSGTPQGHPNSPQLSPTMMPLKETRFYKRALTEDIEPTLRLDTAPGLSWLVRRSVISSIVDGSLVVEPMPSSTKMFIYPCSLCGENRREEGFWRTHRFRTSESSSAQRYPLCNYCLNRLRSTCDYIGFLRMIKDGHRRTDSAETEKAAWEESVRLRERMFWARIGGGVVPNHGRRDSRRESTDEGKPHTPYSAPPHMHNGSFPPEQQTELPPVERGSGLGGIDARLANYAASQKSGEHSDTESSAKEKPHKQSDSEASATDAASKMSSDSQSQFRSVSYEKDHEGAKATGAAPTSVDASQGSPPAPIKSPGNEQGLQITIPGGYQF